MVHLAMHDAYFILNPAPHGTYLAAPPAAPPTASAEAAIAAAAHSVLSALYPTQKARFDLAHIHAGLGGKGLMEGHTLGLAIGQALLDARASDPGLDDDGYAASIARYAHRADPNNPTQGYYAPSYGARSACFAVTSRLSLDPPPKRGDALYDDALHEVRGKGIAPELMGTLPAGYTPRTPEETVIGLFWAYDGAKKLGTPPRHYNQIIRQIAAHHSNTVADNARLFALVNAAMADSGILSWDDKWSYDLWRPVLGIREDDPSMGPAADGGSALTDECDPGWLPFGAQRTNDPGHQNFTPNFPSYPSGHATFGAAAFQVTRRFYHCDADQADNLADDLEFFSDELDGVNVDNHGTVRPRHVRTFPGGLWQMIEENGRSRVYLGVHWVFDAFAVDAGGDMDLTQNVGGVRLGRDVANNLWTNGLKEANAAGPRLP